MRWNYVKSALLWGLGLFAIFLVLDWINGESPIETHGAVIKIVTLYVMFIPLAAIFDVIGWLKEKRRQRAYRAVFGDLDPSNLAPPDRSP